MTLLYPNDNHNNDLQSVEDTLLKDNRVLTENENEQKSETLTTTRSDQAMAPATRWCGITKNEYAQSIGESSYIIHFLLRSSTFLPNGD